MVCLPSKAGGPFLNLIVVFGEYIRVNILIFFISSGGMVEGSSLTVIFQNKKIAVWSYLSGLREGDHLFVKWLFFKTFKRVVTLV